MGKKCRACAIESKNLLSLFTGNRRKGALINEFNFILKGHIEKEADETDSLPKTICKNCVKKLDVTFKFLQQCIEAEAQLKIVQKAKSVPEKCGRKKKRQSKTAAPTCESIEPKPDPVTNEITPKPEEVIQEKEPEYYYDDLLQDDNSESNATQHTPAASETLNSRFVCNVCGKIFKRANSLKTHFLTHEKEQNFTCNYCQRSFANKFRLKNHIRIHTGERPYQCNVCSMTFAQPNALKCHNRLHTGDKPYQCNICEKRFTQNTTLKTHMALHTGKTIQCDLCDKRFTRASFLIQHRRDHTGDRPYACHICPNRYKQKSHLDHHLEVHAGTKYTCEVCGRKYSKKWSLKVHSYTHAKDAGAKLPYSCSYCEESFVRKDKLKSHVRLRHETPTIHEDVQDVPAPSNIVEIESKPVVTRIDSKDVQHRKFHLVNITGNSATIQEILLPIGYEAV